jgi:hypothetical protein
MLQTDIYHPYELECHLKFCFVEYFFIILMDANLEG